LAWFERLIEHSAELIKAGVPIVLAGIGVADRIAGAGCDAACLLWMPGIGGQMPKIELQLAEYQRPGAHV
jgi:hypothetical protein